MRNEIYVSLEGLEGRKAFHSRLAEALEFPDYYGKNLDAMMDCLTDLSEEICLVLTETKGYEEAYPTYFASIVRVMGEAAEENPNFAFRVEA